MPTFLTKETADALCTVITLGFVRQMEANGQHVVFEFENANDADDHELVRGAFADLGVRINVSQTVPQNTFPYILGTVPFNAVREAAFIGNLQQRNNLINDMFNAANEQNQAPRGAYIGVQFFVDQAGNILGEPNIYGPSALTLHAPVYRAISPIEEQAIGIAYYNARKSTNDAAHAVTEGLQVANYQDYDANYQGGHIFGSGHGMIRAMVNMVIPPNGVDSVFAEIALGAGTTKVSSCIPCAIFMQSFGYPASSIHLGRGDNWRIPDNPPAEIVTTWADTIVDCYLSGQDICNPLVALNGDISLNEMITILVTERNAAGDVRAEIPNLFLESLTFEDSFINRIKKTLLPILP